MEANHESNHAFAAIVSLPAECARRPREAYVASRVETVLAASDGPPLRATEKGGPLAPATKHIP